jgi:alpha-beta hydrolase superfamily lysophospholipase
MGGLLAARVALDGDTPLCGLILSSPALSLPLSVGQRLLLRLLSATAPGLAVPNGLPTRFLSHDPAVEQAYLADPLVHPKITARLLQAMLDAAAESHARACELAIPTLLLVAGSDRLIDAGGSQRFFARLAPGIGTLHRYSDYYHELFNEIGAARVFDDVGAWLDSRYPPSLSDTAQ